MDTTGVAGDPRRTRARVALAAGLVVAATGLVIQILTGVPGFPLVPPGPIILLTAAVIVVTVRWRRSSVVGLLAALFIAVGALVAPGSRERLAAPAEIGPFLGTAIQLVGLAVAIVFGVTAVVRARRDTG